jgi:predicted component of type VI protein secretion system
MENEGLILTPNIFSCYDVTALLRRLLRTAGGAIGDPAILAAAMGNHALTSTPSSTTSSLTLTPPPPVPLTAGPPSGGSPSTLPPGSSLEQLLMERAKALRQANPALKAFADIQGENNIFFTFFLRRVVTQFWEILRRCVTHFLEIIRRCVTQFL